MARAGTRVRGALRALSESLRLREPAAERRPGGPQVTVVVPVSDEETTRIEQCLRSLQAQTHRALDVAVVPYGRHERVSATAAALAAQDDRIRLLAPQDSLASARNAGVEAALAELVVVGSGGDDFPPRGIARLVRAHRSSGSPLVVGTMREAGVAGHVPFASYRAAHEEHVSGTALAEHPVAVTDLLLGNRLFTGRLWRESGARFTPEVASGADAVLSLLSAAPAVDLLTEPTYLPTRRRDGVAVGHTPDAFDRLAEWLAESDRLRRQVEALEDQDVLAWWLWGVLDVGTAPFLADVERADDERWALLRDGVRALLERARDQVWPRLSADARVQLWLLLNDHRERLADYATQRLFTGGDRRTEVRDGRVWALLPFHDDADLGVPAELYEMTAEQTRLRATLRDLRWVGDDEIEVTVTAHIEHVGMGRTPELTCALVDPAGGQRVELAVRQFRDLRANLPGNRFQDYSWGAFVATVPVAELRRLSLPAMADTGAADWAFEVTLTTDGVRRTGRIGEIDDFGGAGYLGQAPLAPRSSGDDLVTLAGRSRPTGLVVCPDPLPRLLELRVEGRVVTGTLDPRGNPAATVSATVGGPAGTRCVAEVALQAPDRAVFRLELPGAPAGGSLWSLLLHGPDPDARGRRLRWPAVDDLWLGVGEGGVVGARQPDGCVSLLEAADLLVVDEVVVDEESVTATCRWLAAEPPEAVDVELVGAVRLPGALTQVDGGLRVDFSLLSDRWGLGAAPVAPGPYRIEVRTARGDVEPLLGERAIARLHGFDVGTRFTSGLRRTAEGWQLGLNRALADDERGGFAQQSLQDWYAATDFPLEDAVYLQSYAGASATDSQLALHHELRRTRPDLTLYWGVHSSASWVPEGGVPVLMGSREWYRVLGSVRYLCLNIDPDRWFRRKPGQRLLQTFHGYPAKSMGLRMWRAKQNTPRRIALELERTSGTWDLILTPAPEMDEHYRREYAYEGPIHSHGYPRDDELVGPDAERLREETRRRLGISPEQKVILYAPTWRDDLATNWRRAEIVSHLDLESASRALGPDYVLLMRGHRFHAGAVRRPGAPGAQILDVTDYPEINHLILAADAAVLDYSSLRFDFALTRRPMVFLVPDLDTYVGDVRGFLFDYRDSAPGPLVDTADEAVELLRDLPALAERSAPELDRFHRTYNYLQTGDSARRVAEAFVGGSAD
ncbi:glycosyltransferase [Nocardioides sp. GY 10113]|uniref:bifunctional glycosyltransferase/CDP-glycerol:glycerophosphate glycerophosphotransferase n=1 Tax=Nocardioides sp. GY 10113 TaxID=2569761 RepID=UPI0010A7A74B|nr:CDP-glycerol glycerophosphotransferase family protein [Nocardioides sp. GY 10113]TIC89216.1 glycosyltransferase [Nocardioides sp. GY 10113]